MSASTELRRSIETCELHHAQYEEHYQYFRERVDDALAGFSPRIEWMIGPSRAGKTMILNALEREYPATRTDGVRRVPVLKVAINPSVSPKQFPESVFKALKVPLPKKTNSAGDMHDRMCEQLKLVHTKVMLLEEASHFVEPSARVPPRSAGDMLKTASDNANLTIVAFGIPRLTRLFESNEQLRLRASARRRFLPYDFTDADHRRDFVVCVKTYADLFARAGWPVAFEFGIFVKHCYLLCGGLIGVLSNFMRELASRKRDELPRPLTFEDCQKAASRVESAGHPLHIPFQTEQVAVVDLNQAYGHVMEAFDIPTLRRR